MSWRLLLVMSVLWSSAPGPAGGRAVTAAAAAPATTIATAPAAAPATRAANPLIAVIAPGFPGTTAQAQPTMDLFARAVASAAKRPSADVTAAYFENELVGVAALSRPSVHYALVPLPFYLKHADTAGLTPRLLAEEPGGAMQSWLLAAPRGKVANAAALAGWEILGTPGYAPGFVRMVLADWGVLPADVRILRTAGILSALRRASTGGTVAVLLDRSQAEALKTLPFAGDLEIVATSKPLPSTLFCAVGAAGAGRGDSAGAPGDRGGAPRGDDPIVAALPRLGDTKSGAEALAALRMTRFVPLDPGMMPPLRAAYDAATAARP